MIDMSIITFPILIFMLHLNQLVLIFTRLITVHVPKTFNFGPARNLFLYPSTKNILYMRKTFKNSNTVLFFFH